MTPEELLKPRYKVINIWPGMHLEPFGKDQIVVLQPHKEEDAEGFVYRPDKHKPRNFMWQSFFDLFPHLFQRLEWWQERKPEEMPVYVKSIMQEYSYGVKVGAVIKVKEWVRICEAMYAIQSRREEYHASCFAPATEADYHAYNKQKEANNDQNTRTRY